MELPSMTNVLIFFIIWGTAVLLTHIHKEN